MKITINADFWLSVDKLNKEDIILSTNDGNGNEIELVFEKKWLGKMWLNQFIKDLQEQLK
jgi:hypothetical protein